MSQSEPSLRALGEQSDDELHDILTHIDRQAYPERYQKVRDEYVRRHGDLVNGTPVDEYFDRIRRKRPFAERKVLKKRILIALALWSLVMLAVRAVSYLSSHMRGP
jgi:hypothetical protein